MILHQQHGDLFQFLKAEKIGGIAHGCNCHGVMGAGIAQAIAEEYPEAALADLLYMAQRNDQHYKEFSIGITEDGLIVNLYTQRHPGRVSNPSDLETAIHTSLGRFADTWLRSPALQEIITPETPLGMPRIGCGIAGGDWGKIGAIIDEVTRTMPVIIVDRYH